MYRTELHLHIDGSLREETIMELLDRESIHNEITITDSDKTLNDYLKKFDLPIAILQNRENLKRVSYELVEDLYTEETLYAELRLAPIQHMKMGLTGSDVVEAVLDGIENFTKNHPITVKLLLCVMRHLTEEENMFLLDLYDEFKERGVVGLDLAGDEYNHSCREFETLFFRARSKEIPFTIHAGEARGAESVYEAIKLGAKRIGHGIRSYSDEVVLQLIRDNNVCLEFCPTSNIQTGIFKDLTSYPIKTFIEHNIPFTINSDNRTVSGTSCLREEQLLKEFCSITDEQIKQTHINAIEHSFLNEIEKKRLTDFIRSQYGIK